MHVLVNGVRRSAPAAPRAVRAMRPGRSVLLFSILNIAFLLFRCLSNFEGGPCWFTGLLREPYADARDGG